MAKDSSAGSAEKPPGAFAPFASSLGSEVVGLGHEASPVPVLL